VSGWITLSLRGASRDPLDLTGVTADRCAQLSETEIAMLPVWSGARHAAVGDFFAVRGGGTPRIRFEGSLENIDGLAAGNAGGEVVIDGSPGAGVGAAMTGGRVEVTGSAGHDAGVAMSGGLLRIRGNAGDRLGAATPGASRGMSGGEIVVSGSAGAEAAACCRRGLVVVGGLAGTDAGRAMIAGTLVALGEVSGTPGRGNKRGSIVSAGPIAVPSTYRYACTIESTWVRFLMTYLIRQHGLAIDPRVAAGAYERYCGDAGDPGKGEILVLVRAS